MRNRDWKIQRKGRQWVSGEAMKRYYMTPEKIEMIRGKLFWCERDRVKMLGLLLENIGADKAVRLGDPEVWRAAGGSLPKSRFSEQENGYIRHYYDHHWFRAK